MLRKQNEARSREIRKREERIKELKGAPDNHEDAVQEPTSEIDRKNDGETYGTGRNDEEIYRCSINSTPRISKINMHSSQVLWKMDDIRGYRANERDWDRCLYFLRDKLARYLSVCPWNFTPGWSNKERSIELGLEATLCDPDIRWSTKEGYILSISSLLRKTVKPGRQDHPRKPF